MVAADKKTTYSAAEVATLENTIQLNTAHEVEHLVRRIHFAMKNFDAYTNTYLG